MMDLDFGYLIYLAKIHEVSCIATLVKYIISIFYDFLYPFLLVLNSKMCYFGLESNSPSTCLKSYLFQLNAATN